MRALLSQKTKWKACGQATEQNTCVGLYRAVLSDAPQVIPPHEREPDAPLPPGWRQFREIYHHISTEVTSKGWGLPNQSKPQSCKEIACQDIGLTRNPTPYPGEWPEADAHMAVRMLIRCPYGTQLTQYLLVGAKETLEHPSQLFWTRNNPTQVSPEMRIIAVTDLGSGGSQNIEICYGLAPLLMAPTVSLIEISDKRNTKCKKHPDYMTRKAQYFKSSKLDPRAQSLMLWKSRTPAIPKPACLPSPTLGKM